MKARAIVAWNVRRIRVGKGLSQEKLAADASVDRAYLAKLERQSVNTGVDVLDKLADALSVSVADLFEIPAEGAPPPVTLRGGRKRS
ncbi:helix-turn-helix transcriptional regulator [Rhizobium leguminosarum]|uniref:helix-turn-helix domain-containing protein n=1 Tax=Rhizobium TaxID=379 RepID=UPI0010309374|nr:MULTISPECIES: helix-turn-helix transcriptional regulator [Rhizobium]MBY5442722.1 helix-turn-helix transcriptional regulator [Rhizobium leguminosarum]TBA59668.1 XRE family transcriptional regulator [Rhizobium ruizarguesonis]